MPRGRRGPPRRKKLAEAGKVVELTVDRLGAQADGIARHDGKTVYVAGALPGEVVTARIVDRRGDGLVATLEAVADPAPQRIVPVCTHFGTCGGCALQHLAPDAVADWRRDQVAQALARRGVDVPLDVLSPEAATNRRRARFALAVGRDGSVRVGFHGRRQRQVVAVDRCPQVDGRLLAAAQAVAAALSGHVGQRGPVDIIATLTDTGIDLLLVGPADLSAPARLALAGCSGDGDIARLSWQPDDNAAWEPLAVHRAPMVTFDGVAVDVPPGGFLQPTAAGEACLAGIVAKAVAGAQRVVDLFAGLGTFSLPLSRGANVAAFEGDATLVAALETGGGPGRPRRAAERFGPRPGTPALAAEGIRQGQCRGAGPAAHRCAGAVPCAG